MEFALHNSLPAFLFKQLNCCDKIAKEFLVKKFSVFFLTLAIVLAFGLAFTACGCDDTTRTSYDPIVHQSYNGGTAYKLEITKNTGKAAFTPAAGDFFILTITKAGAAPKVSSGSIQYVTGGNTFTLIHSGGGTFSVTISSSGGMISIAGSIPLDDGTAEPGPGEVSTTPPSGDNNNGNSGNNNGNSGNNNGGNNNNNGGGNKDAKTIIITGITDITGMGVIGVMGDDMGGDDARAVAANEGTVSNNSLTISLHVEEDGQITVPWTVSGSYFLVMVFYDPDDRFAEKDEYVYTNGKTWAELGITFPFEFETEEKKDTIKAKLPKYNISSATSTIPFSQFCYAPGFSGSSDGGENVDVGRY
jgi:hypothetical protein